MREQEMEATLQFMAKETGGKPLLNSNRTGKLASARGAVPNGLAGPEKK